jgi:hypothetical protein
LRNGVTFPEDPSLNIRKSIRNGIFNLFSYFWERLSPDKEAARRHSSFLVFLQLLFLGDNLSQKYKQVKNAVSNAFSYVA